MEKFRTLRNACSSIFRRGNATAKSARQSARQCRRRGKSRPRSGERSKTKRHREERQAVQATGEEQARKALQEKARKEREANGGLNTI
jgi:hypothetical protein